MKIALIALAWLALGAPVLAAGDAGWQVFARDDGCVGLETLARRERLPRVPTSPDDYARLLRERGETVTVGVPPGFPPELAGKAVQVTAGSGKAPVFVRGELCRAADAKR